MSLFQTVELACPACGEVTEFEAVYSVNADRRPDLRDEIIAGTFQQKNCAKCNNGFRLDPEFTYVDLGRHQWLAAQPLSKLNNWTEAEAQARAAFDKAYGPTAGAGAREIGADLVPRIAFGWAAVREKLIVAEHGLSDVELELTKIAIVRGSEESPLSNETELRLAAMEGENLVLVWVVAAIEELVEKLAAPRSLYDEIAADKEGWQELREELSRGLFVDMQRLMIASKAAAAT